MPLSLSTIRSLVRENAENGIRAMITVLISDHAQTAAQAIRRYEKMCNIIHPDETIAFQASDWDSNLFDLAEDMHEVSDGYVTSYEVDNHGFTCAHCDVVYDVRTVASHSMNQSTAYVCDNCFSSEDSGFYERNGQWYTSESDYRRFNGSRSVVFGSGSLARSASHSIPPPDEARYSSLTFRSADELYMSYSERMRTSDNTLPNIPTDFLQTAMLNYSANPLQYRHGFLFNEDESLPINPLWLGIELEVQPSVVGIKTPGFFHKVASNLRFTVIKSDGSLPIGGFEICSVPATLDKHRVLWKGFFDEAGPLLRSWSADGQRCGMHVHMNRAFFTQSEVAKALLFVNADENRPFIEKVAGRSAAHYCQAINKTTRDAVSDSKRSSTGHYDALSLSGHTGKTLELRIFRGNVAQAGFFKNLEFTDAMSHFVKDASAKELKSKDFLAWLAHASNRKRYQFLTGWALKNELFKGLATPKFSEPQTAKLELERFSA